MAKKNLFSGYEELELTKIKPQGWLLNQLRIQADGITSDLPECWDEVSEKSAWLGGKGEAWELGPYYMDGLVPLAYVLSDGKLLDKAGLWVKAVLDSQQADGDFGPQRTKDWWPRCVALKALMSYYEATNDAQVITFMRRFFKYMYNTLDENPPRYWAAARAFEYIVPIEFVYKKTGDEFLLDLVEKIKGFSYDWTSYFENFRFKHPAGRYISKPLVNFGRKIGAKSDYRKKHGLKPLKTPKASATIRFNKRRFVKKLMLTHGVNVAMAMKYPAIYGNLYDAYAPCESLKKGIQSLYKHHGTAVGMFTSDEHLDGTDPTKGIELCAVAEAMFSFQKNLLVTGDPFYADLLETVAYNALPAMFTDNMSAHQDVQQVNQLSASVKKRKFFDVNDDANTFGLLPNYGCCTANLHQAWPKFLKNLCFKRADELAFMVYAPCAVETAVGEGEVKISERTDYPFGDEAVFAVEKVAGNPQVTLTFRVPKYTTLEIYLGDKLVAKETKGLVKLKRVLKEGDEIKLKFVSEPVAVVNPNKSVSFRKGSLVLASKQNFEKQIIGGKAPHNTYAFYNLSQWRNSPIIRKDGTLEVLKTVSGENFKSPFDAEHPPFEIEVAAVPVANWEEKDGDAGKIPKKAVYTEQKTMTLVPYGATVVRIAQFPQIKQK